MELLLPANPIIQTEIPTKSISKMYNHLVDESTNLNIATGFISNDSIAALKQIVKFREGELSLSLFIGMNYLEGFTKTQYHAVRDLNSFLTENRIGNIYLSTLARYHGKMYSFMKGKTCLASFVGSSNLGSFVGTSQNYIEADVLFRDGEGKEINKYISKITFTLGKKFADIPIIEKFIENNTALLDGYAYVKKLTKEETKDILQTKTREYVDVPLKTESKSNLNGYFGKGKIKDSYSPRGWYEVELILSKKLEGRDLLPKDFIAVTTDGYEFLCSRQGDYLKNLRSAYDLKILGRWIKGQMENSGALEVGTPVTEETLQKFGKSVLRFTKTTSGKFIMSLR